jgi:hypothetical protein
LIIGRCVYPPGRPPIKKVDAVSTVTIQRLALVIVHRKKGGS